MPSRRLAIPRSHRRQRGVAIMMVLIALTLAAVLAMSFLGAQATSTAVARNVANSGQARITAESGLAYVIQHIRSNDDWRTERSQGRWITDQPFGDGTFSLWCFDGYDRDGDGQIEGDGDLADDADEPFTLRSRGQVDSVTYTIEARVTPVRTMALKVLLIVGDADLSAADRARQSLIESFGFDVTVLAAGASKDEYEQAAADVDVIYVSEQVASDHVRGKIDEQTIGIVCEEGYLDDDLGVMSDDGPGYTESQITITDNTHYITSPFAEGPLALTRDLQPLRYHHGSPAAGAKTLATRYWSSAPTLVTLDAGASRVGGQSSPGRRVLLPWGDNHFDVDALTPNGKTLMRRAIEWAGVRGGGSIAGGIAVLADVSLTGSARVDAIDSTTDGYSAWVYGGAGAKVATNAANDGQVKLTGSAQIMGDVYVGVGGNPDEVVELKGSSRVDGTTSALTTPVVVPDIPSPGPLPGSEGNESINGSDTVTFSEGVYHYNRFSVGGSARVTITGNVTIYCDDTFSIAGSGRVVLAEGASLTLYAADYSFTGSAEMNLDTPLPQAVTIYQTGSKKSDVTGSAKVVAQIIAPAAEWNVTGSGRVFGAFSGKSIDLTGSARFTQDLALGKGGSSGGGGGDPEGNVRYTYRIRWVEP